MKTWDWLGMVIMIIGVLFFLQGVNVINAEGMITYNSTPYMIAAAVFFIISIVGDRRARKKKLKKRKKGII